MTKAEQQSSRTAEQIEPRRAASAVLSVGLLFCCSAVLVPGCTLNRSPIHSQLSPIALEERVLSRWSIGMSAPDAEQAARLARLRPEGGELPEAPGAQKGRHGMTAKVGPPGVRSAVRLPWEETGHLYFWFDADEQLERIVYRLPPRHMDHPIHELQVIAERQESSP